MKNRMRFLLVSLAVASATGCATVAKGPSFAESKASKAKPGNATIYVYREYAEPTAWGAEIQINGQSISTLNQKGFTWAYAAPGKTEIKAIWSGMSGQKDSVISIDTVEGKTFYVELTGISKVAAVSYPTFYFKLGSGLNEVNPDAAVKKLEACCKFQKPL